MVRTVINSALLVIMLVVVAASRPLAISAIPEETNLRSVGQLEAALNALTELNVALEKNADQHQVLKTFHRAKRMFKKCEFIVEHFQSATIKLHVNGPPLPQILPKTSQMLVAEPQGFQRLEELIYEEQRDAAEIKRINDLLISHLSQMIRYQKGVGLGDRQVLEAIRYEVIRAYTLGLTGFDAPASDSALSQTKHALKAALIPLKHYGQTADDDLLKSALAIEKRMDHYFKTADFDAFDRYGFLIEVTDPLFSLVLKIQTELGVETLEEVNTQPIATNYANVKSIYDINLLNRDFFYKGPWKEVPEERIELGKRLFFDPNLSFNNSLACASCHLPEKGFTDGQPKSISNDGKTQLERNAPTLLNALFAEAYFHDLRTDRLEKQTEHVMVSEAEFNMQTLALAEKLALLPEYQKQFVSAFPGQKEPIKPHNIQSAIASYVATLTSWNSSFDQFVLTATKNIPDSIRNGYNLFMGKAACGTCHFPPTFAGLVPPYFDDSESEVLGILKSDDTLSPVLDADLGRYDNGKRSEHADFFKHSIKTPTVRNVAITAPYFHNGSFKNLEDVMWFYKKGGGAGLGLDVPNQTLPFDNLVLSKTEIHDIIAFMNSLTDNPFD